MDASGTATTAVGTSPQRRTQKRGETRLDGTRPETAAQRVFSDSGAGRCYASGSAVWPKILIIAWARSEGGLRVGAWRKDVFHRIRRRRRPPLPDNGLGDLACAWLSWRSPVGDVLAMREQGIPPAMGAPPDHWDRVLPLGGQARGQSVERNPVGRNPRDADMNETSSEISYTVETDSLATAERAAAAVDITQARPGPQPSA